MPTPDLGARAVDEVVLDWYRPDLWSKGNGSSDYFDFPGSRGVAKAGGTQYLCTEDVLMHQAKALSVQKLLRAEYPNAHHADCGVWATWLMKIAGE